MGQPATAGIIVACIFIGMAVAYFGYRGYVKWHRHRTAPLDAELPPIRQPLGHSMYAGGGAVSGSWAASPSPGTPEYSSLWRSGAAGSMSKSSFAMDRPGSIYGGGLSTFGGGDATSTSGGGAGGYHSRSHSLAGLSPPAVAEHDSRPTSPYSGSNSYPIDSTSLAELGVAVPPRVASPDAISEGGSNAAPGPSSTHRQRTMSSSSSTMTLRRSYAGDYYSASRRNSALFGSSGSGSNMAGGSGGPSKRDSYLPHLPSNRDAIQIVPPQPLGIGLGGMATAMDQKTLAFSKSSGIGLGEEAFGDSKSLWNDAATGGEAGTSGQDLGTQHQHQRSLSPSSVSASGSGSGSIGPQQLHRYLQEGPLGRNSEAARRNPWEATGVSSSNASVSGGYAGVPPLRGGTPQSSHYNGTTANSSPILGAQQQQQHAQHHSKPLPSQPHSSSDSSAAAGSSSSRSASGTAGSPSAASGSGGSRSNDDGDAHSPHHTHNDSLSSSMTTTTKTSHDAGSVGSPVPGDAPHKLGSGEHKAATYDVVTPLTTAEVS